jgi:hypothetical protein
METKKFKSVYIHNGCRSPKMKVVHPVPKIKLCESIAIGASTKIQYLVDLNLSLMDAEIHKANLYGKQYFGTFEHSIIKFNIILNNVRIEFHKSFLSAFIKLATKFKLL